MELFELAVAIDVFRTAITGADGRPLYRLSVCGPAPSVMTAAGFAMQVPSGLNDARRRATPSSWCRPERFTERPAPAAVLDALRFASGEGKRILSLCTGAFVLAEAGLLDGRTATTHWSECADLARAYPKVRVDPKVLYVDEE